MQYTNTHTHTHTAFNIRTCMRRKSIPSWVACSTCCLNSSAKARFFLPIARPVPWDVTGLLSSFIWAASGGDTVMAGMAVDCGRTTVDDDEFEG